MAAGTVFIQIAANLFCGDHDPTKSKHLTLEEMGLPALEEVFQDHNPGGAPVQVEFGMNVVSKLLPTFKLKGEDPDLAVQFGLGRKVRNVYTSYGVVQDKRTGRNIEAKAIIEARLGKIAPDPFSRGSLKGHDYALNEVMHYEVYFDGVEKYYWDFFLNTWRVDGVDQNADINRIQRIL